MSAIFNFQSLLTVILLLICTCAYIRSLAPSLLDKNKTGAVMKLSIKGSCMWTCLPLFSLGAGMYPEHATFIKELSGLSTLQYRLLGIFWKCARIGERKSPYVAICCIVMAFSILFIQ